MWDSNPGSYMVLFNFNGLFLNNTTVISQNDTLFKLLKERDIFDPRPCGWTRDMSRARTWGFPTSNLSWNYSLKNGLFWPSDNSESCKSLTKTNLQWYQYVFPKMKRSKSVWQILPPVVKVPLEQFSLFFSMAYIMQI